LIELDEIDQALAARLELLDPCYQCGTCSGLCPYSPITEFRPRKLVLRAQLEPESVLQSELLWQCSACWACVPRCPMDVRPPELFSALRARALEEGTVPDAFAKTLFDSLQSVHRYGNPWGYPSRGRTEWAAGLDVQQMAAGVEVLYYVGCSPSYDPRVRGVPQALVEIFKRGGSTSASSARRSAAAVTPSAGWVRKGSSRHWPRRTQPSSTDINPSGS